MTKKIIIAVSILACCALIFAACGDNKTTDEILSESVSSRQSACYTGSDENVEITLTTLSQEEAFIADGKVGNVVTRTTLVVRFATAPEGDLAYTLQSETGKIEGTLSKNVLGSAYIADIADVSAIGTPTTVVVTVGGGEEETTSYSIALNDRMADVIDSDEAVKTAYEYYKQQIDAEIASEDGWQREIFVRYVGDRKDADVKYYWYVCFARDRGDDMSVLIDPATKEIVNSRVRP